MYIIHLCQLVCAGLIQVWKNRIGFLVQREGVVLCIFLSMKEKYHFLFLRANHARRKFTKRVCCVIGLHGERVKVLVRSEEKK